MSAVLDPSRIAPADDLNRRRFISGVGALVLGLGLAGCDDEEIAGAGATRRVTTPEGPVDVPVDPQRVVVLEGRRDLDIPLSLELPIVAYAVQGIDGEAIPGPLLQRARAATRAEPVFFANEISIEAVATAGPDLIIGRTADVEEIATRLARVAPVLTVRSGEEPWQADLDLVARATGREARAAEILAGYEARLDGVRSRVGGSLRSARIGIFQADAEGVSLTGPRGFNLQCQVLTDLGGRLAAAQAGLGPKEYPTISPERLVEVMGDADAILLIVNARDERRAIESSPLWDRLPAVRAGRVETTNFQTNYGGPLTALAALEAVERTYATLGSETS